MLKLVNMKELAGTLVAGQISEKYTQVAGAGKLG
jgi:hypothetical protein